MASKGKITNKDSSESLEFNLNPTSFRLNRQFDFNVEACIGQAASVVAYRSGGNTQLSFQLRFDRDTDGKCDVKGVHTFLKGLNKVDDKKKSVPVVDFSLGSFKFAGFVSTYLYQPTRFDEKAEATSVTVDLTIISNGEYETGK